MNHSHIQIRQHNWPRRVRAMLATIFMINLLFGSVVAYAGDFSKEDAIKAAFVFHFAHFIEWPADQSEAFTIGVLGEDPFNGALEIIRGKMVNGQAIRIKQLMSTDRAINDVQVLVVGGFDDDANARLLASAASQPILTIADQDVSKVDGAIITLYRKGTRQKFGIDRNAARLAGLTLSSQLLQIATVVD